MKKATMTVAEVAPAAVVAYSALAYRGGEGHNRDPGYRYGAIWRRARS